MVAERRRGAGSDSRAASTLGAEAFFSGPDGLAAFSGGRSGRGAAGSPAVGGSMPRGYLAHSSQNQHAAPAGEKVAASHRGAKDAVKRTVFARMALSPSFPKAGRLRRQTGVFWASQANSPYRLDRSHEPVRPILTHFWGVLSPLLAGALCPAAWPNGGKQISCKSAERRVARAHHEDKVS
jgi:hypothetical protein